MVGTLVQFSINFSLAWKGTLKRKYSNKLAACNEGGSAVNCGQNTENRNMSTRLRLERLPLGQAKSCVSSY